MVRRRTYEYICIPFAKITSEFRPASLVVKEQVDDFDGSFMTDEDDDFLGNDPLFEL
jgi:hypothetical protein